MNSGRSFLFLAATVAVAGCGDTIEEITETVEYDGSALVRSTTEAAGENCEFGGTAIAVGLDTDADGTLSDAEVDSTSYVCNAEGGSALPPIPGTAVSDEAAGENCEFGGVRVDTGTDANADGTLSTDEIASTEYICFDGGTAPALVSEVSFVAGDDMCPHGYLVTTVGLDTDGSGVVDGEETSFAYTGCNAAPTFGADPTIAVDDCGSALSYDVMVTDPDGTVASIEVEELRSLADGTFTIDDSGVIGLPAGTHEAGASLLVTATDNWGATASKTFFVRFNGTGCEPLELFYGADPTTCREIDVENVAGDDRGSVVVTRDWVYYNGDDALVRMTRELEDVTAVTTGGESVDTLVSSGDTLYSLWNSEFTITSLDGYGGDELDYPLFFDQLVIIDEGDLSIGDAITLEHPISLMEDGLAGYPLEPAIDFDGSDLLMAIADGKLLVINQGYDATNAQSAAALLVFDLSDGSLVNVAMTTETVANDFGSQEADIVASSAVVIDGIEYIYAEDGGFYRVNMRTGEATLATDSFADDCDADVFAFDPWSLQVFGHAEYGCFGNGIYHEEAIYVCGVLWEENDGSIDDSGEGD